MRQASYAFMAVPTLPDASIGQKAKLDAANCQRCPANYPHFNIPPIPPNFRSILILLFLSSKMSWLGRWAPIQHRPTDTPSRSFSPS